MAKKKSAGANQKQAGRRRGFKFVYLLIWLISFAVIINLFGNYYFIRTSERILVIPKLHFGFRDSYIDMRKWSGIDLFYHAEVEQAIIKQGGKKLLNQIQQGLTQVEQ
jgi:hypothetical protein